MATGVAPDPRFGPAVFGQYSWASAPLSARLTLLHLLDAHSDRDPAGQSVSLSAARLEGCHRGWGQELVRVFPCVGVAGGWLRTEGAVSRSSVATSAWWEGGLFAHLQLRLTTRVWIDGQGGLVAPFRRYRFAFENPYTVVYETPAVAAAAGIGLGGRIP